ncbi:hypothetical protein GA0115253_1033024 [Streptomyces sp. Termitarium-T10T-6]|nr:hypothetical protein GA0115253_1033024 [Streptomyces sp. Termitarium-T10T-6]
MVFPVPMMPSTRAEAPSPANAESSISSMIRNSLFRPNNSLDTACIPLFDSEDESLETTLFGLWSRVE